MQVSELAISTSLNYSIFDRYSLHDTEPVKSCLLVLNNLLLIIINFIWLCLGLDLTVTSPAASSAVDFSAIRSVLLPNSFLSCRYLDWAN